MSFFETLLALLTFDWLKRRQASKEAIPDIVELMPRGECAACEDDVYFDPAARVWKHASTRSVMRATPHGSPHAAVKWLGWPRIHAAEATPTDVRSGPHPR